MPASFELILDDSSPVIGYFPFAETLGVPNLLAGWNSYFSHSGFLSQPGQAGVGTSLHITSLDGAALTIQWFGTGISLWGSVFEAAYDISLDGAEASIGLPRGDLLVEIQGLEATQHSVALIAHPISPTVNSSSFIAFDFAVLNVTTEITGSTISSELVSDTSPLWSFSGDWTELSDPVLASQPSQTYHVSTTRGNTASISFRGSAVSITGVRNVTNGHYNVTLDGTSTMFDGHSDWLETSVLFLQAGLDEETHHTLAITNADDASLAIAGLNITHVTGGAVLMDAVASGPTTGTIIALALSGFVAVLAVLSLIACICYQRGRRRPQSPRFNVDAGIRSSTFFRQFDSALSPTRSGRCSGNPSIYSEYALQDLRTEPPPLTGSVNRDGPDRKGAGDDFPAMLIVQSGFETVDPASPTPYLRVSRPSTFSVEFRDAEHEGHERPRLARSKARDTHNLESPLGLFDAPSRPDSVVDPTMQLPQEAHTATQPRRRSASTTKVPRLRLDISNPSASASAPRSATSSVKWASPRQLSSSRRSQRTARHTAFGATQSPSPMTDTPMSVSTMCFARSWQEGGGGSESPSIDHSVASDVPLAALRKDNRTSKNLLDRLQLRRAQA